MLTRCRRANGDIYRHYLLLEKGTKPTIDRIRAAADMLDTSADYLLGRTDNPVSIDELVDGVTPHEQELLNAYRAMSPQEQQMVCRMVGIKHPDEKQKKNKQHA